MFGCILENALKNILQYYLWNNVKWKKKKKIQKLKLNFLNFNQNSKSANPISIRNTTITCKINPKKNHCKPTTIKPPQTHHKPQSQQNPLNQNQEQPKPTNHHNREPPQVQTRPSSPGAWERQRGRSKRRSPRSHWPTMTGRVAVWGRQRGRGFLCERDGRDKGCCTRETEGMGDVLRGRRRRWGVVVVQGRQRGGGFAVREKKEGAVLWEKEQGGLRRAKFWKMVYKIIERKPFSMFLHRLFQSTEMIFRLTSILQRNKHSQIWKHYPENILQRNKRSLHDDYFYRNAKTPINFFW